MTQRIRRRPQRRVNLNSVARQIVTLREKSGLTQRELSKRTREKGGNDAFGDQPIGESRLSRAFPQHAAKAG